MSASSRLRAPNPHLGAYYGIVASAFVSLAIMLAMLEQLGWSETFVAETMVGVPLVLYLIIAVGARTMTIEDFFASGRRVPVDPSSLSDDELATIIAQGATVNAQAH